MDDIRSSLNKRKDYSQEKIMEVTKVTNATRDFKIGEVETHALRGVNLSVNSGEFTALVGPSGSGKTTLLQLIGLLDLPTSGQVFIKGNEASGLSRDQRADLRKQTIGFIFQFFALIPTLTAYENVELPLLLNGVKPTERQSRVSEMIEAVGLSDRSHHRPDQLSGGEQQRIAVARALSIKPSLVLADEPTANLDTENGKQVMDIMQKLNRETGVTFIFATHDPRVIKYAQRIVTLRDGVIVDENGKSKT
jgi:putative ABC transport system ATP-binding protein